MAGPGARSRGRWFVAISLALAVPSLGCSRLPTSWGFGPDATTSPAAAASPSASQATTPRPLGPDECVLRWDALAEVEALPGAPAFEERRADILGRAKGEPILFVRTPQPTALTKRPLEQLRLRLGQKSPLLSIPETLRATRNFPEDARALFLSEGYVFSADPTAATVLVDTLTLGRLFREPTIYLARGTKVHELHRDAKWKLYRYAEGDDRNEEATLLLGDRLSLTREGLFPLLHREIDSLIDETGADRLSIDRLTEKAARVQLFFGNDVLRAVADDDGSRLRLSCIERLPADKPKIAEIQAENRSRRRSLASVRRATRDMVRERLRFDEPLEEEGQQDGSLRPLWRWMYDHGGHGYRFNDIPYQVFDGQGRPYPPQVCVDFVLDTYERASGTWFGTSGQDRGRTSGTIDFDALGVENRRSAANLADFALSRPDIFDVWNLTPEERIPYGRKQDFFRTLAEKRGAFHEGDIVVIHGMKADGKAHYHSFLIDTRDPITGIPIRLAGNAGRPRLQTWEGVMRSAPARSVRHVLSPRTDWLRKTLGRDLESVAAAPTGLPSADTSEKKTDEERAQ
jgi:hypothetical protein